MKRTLILFAASVVTFVPSASLARPTSTPPTSGSISPAHETGQPGASCEDLGNQPGNSMNNTGSAFSPTGTAGGVYAGEQKNINDKNTASVSQYDQACAVNQSPQVPPL